MISADDLEECRRALHRRLWRRRVGITTMTRAPLRVADAIRYSGFNVHGVATGRRLTGRTLTDDRCVSVFVTAKLPEGLLAPDERIPRELDGIPIDVVQASPAEFVALAVGMPAAARTAQAGQSSAHEDILFGTLGWFCRWKPGEGPESELLALSANHVFADLERGQPGDAILQPSRGQGGSAANRIAELVKTVAFQRSGANRVDVAVARLVDGVVASAGIGAQGRPNGVAEGQIDDTVWKVGAATLETHGQVTGVHLATELTLPGSLNRDERIEFEELMLVRPTGQAPFVQPGDSGSLLVRASDGAATGIVIGQIWIEQDSQWYGIACDLQEALDRLGVALL